MLNRKYLGIALHSWFLVLIILAAFLIRLQGINWPRFHPDEYPIAHWIERGSPDRVYPGGTFVLIRPFRFVWTMAHGGIQFMRSYTSHYGHDVGVTVRPDYILMGRYFNAVIGSLACLFIYLTTYTLLKSRSAALFSALLMAFAQLPVEHAHYAQTDIPMLFVMCVLLWFWTNAIARDHAGWFVAAGLACGAAAGTKFTLMMLFFPWLLYCLLRGVGASRERRILNSLKYTVAGLLLFAVGLVAASPDILDLRPFMAGMAHQKARVYGETVTNLGIMAGDNRVRMLTHLHALMRNMLTPGVGWLVLWIAGLPLLLKREYRRFWIPLLGVPLVYTYYWIAVAPWVRRQEFLNYLPAAAVLASVPLVYVWRRWSHPAVKCLVLIVALLAFGVSFERSMRVSSIYGWLDSRLLATRWLQRHEPPGITLATEKYASVQSPGRRVDVDMAARVGLERLQAQGFDFLLSQGTRGTRGMFNPLTGELYPHYEAAYQHFMDGTDFLKSWAVLPPVGTHTTFSSMPIELFGLRKGTGEHVLEMPLSRPAFVSKVAYETFYPRGHHLASATALLVDHHGVTVGVTSAQEWDQPVYIVLYTEERPADVTLRGLGRRARVQLAPYEHVVVPFKRPAWLPRLGHIEKIHARASKRKHITYIPCYLQLAFSREEAAAIVADLPSAPDREERVTLGQRVQMEAILEADPSAIDYMGVSASAYDQFARFRLSATTPLYQPFPLRLREPVERTSVFSGSLRLPFRRTPAPLTVRFDVLAYTDPVDGENDDPILRFFEEQTGTLLGTLVLDKPMEERYRGVTLAIPPGSASLLDIRVESPTKTDLQFYNVEISWRFHDELAAELRRIAAREAQRLSAPGDREDALPLAGVEAGTDLDPVHKLDVSFLPFARVIGIREGESGKVTVLFEARQEAPPALNAVLYRRRRGKWRVVERVPLFDRTVAAGQRVVIPFELPPEGAETKRGPFGIGVEAASQWLPGRLRIADHEEDVFRLPERIERASGVRP